MATEAPQPDVTADVNRTQPSTELDAAVQQQDDREFADAVASMEPENVPSGR